MTYSTSGVVDVSSEARYDARSREEGLILTPDDRVNAWIIQRFRERHGRFQSHMSVCPDLKVKPYSCEHGVECGCYSEYTRDDSWYLPATLECPHGKEMSVTLSDFGHTLPDAVAAIANADYDNFECIYDSEE